jgi:hypothetical protein
MTGDSRSLSSRGLMPSSWLHNPALSSATHPMMRVLGVGRRYDEEGMEALGEVQGAQATVYRARLRSSGQEVIVKQYRHDASLDKLSFPRR